VESTKFKVVSARQILPTSIHQLWYTVSAAISELGLLLRPLCYVSSELVNYFPRGAVTFQHKYVQLPATDNMFRPFVRMICH
jgi:hypothetical protein